MPPLLLKYQIFKIKTIIFLIVLAVIFFLINWQYLGEGPMLFNSPDEMANYFFSELYSKTSSLNALEPLSGIAKNEIHPRSITINNGYLIPQGFVGLPLIYGTLGKIFGLKAIIYFTPLVSILALFFFFGWLKKIFEAKIALVSTLLLLILPPFWYYNARSLYPNVLFLDLLIIGFYFLFLISPKYHFSYDREKSGIGANWVKWSLNYIRALLVSNLPSILGGLFIGLALSVRPSEIIWVLMILMALYLGQRKKISRFQVILTMTMIIIGLFPTFYYQQILYSHPLSIGYPQKNIIDRFLPFGFHPMIAIIHFYQYFIWLFWWWTIPLLYGLLALIKNFKDLPSSIRKYLLTFLFLGLWLIIYYGSGTFDDLVGLQNITLSSSYPRYWLPLFVFSLPLVSFGFYQLKKKNTIFCLVALVTFIFLNLWSVWFKEPDGLKWVKQRLKGDKAIQQKILFLTHSQVLLMVDRGDDKKFFPWRRVMMVDWSRQPLSSLKNIAKLTSVYYYTQRDEREIQYLNEKYLAPFQLVPYTQFNGHRLYQLKL